MSTQAQVLSLDALETFRASLIVFSSKALSVVDQVTDEIRRTRGWVQQEQRRYWEAEVKKRDRLLVQAKQELMGVKMVGMVHNFSAQQAAVRKAAEGLEHAETKLRHVKRWTRDFDSALDPLARSLETFRGVLGRDLPQANAFLLQAQLTLAAYREAHAPAAPRAAEAAVPNPPEP